MMKQLMGTGILAVTAFGGLAACTSLHVTSDVNKAVASSVQCHTFAWAGTFKGDSPLRNSIANPVNEARLRSAITAHLAAVGVQPVTGDSADCLVGYGIGARTSIEGAYPAGWGWGWGYGRWGWRGYYGGYWGWDEPYVYHEGIIAMDLYDAKSKQPIWHASANQSLEGAVGADAEQKIDKAVTALFSKYPTPHY
jgi:Domain of unknown function (DUF4136)